MRQGGPETHPLQEKKKRFLHLEELQMLLFKSISGYLWYVSCRSKAAAVESTTNFGVK